jgi:hypothetical protein
MSKPYDRKYCILEWNGNYEGLCIVLDELSGEPNLFETEDQANAFAFDSCTGDYRIVLL